MGIINQLDEAQDRPHPRGASFKSELPPKKMSNIGQGKLSAKEVHRNEVEKDLIGKAYWIVSVVVVFLFVIFLIDALLESGAYTSDIIHLFGTIATFVLGFLFGTRHGK